MSRNRCACCGKPYGRRMTTTERFVVRIGEPLPRPKSNQPIIATRVWPPMPEDGGPAFPEDATSYTPIPDPAEDCSIYRAPQSHPPERRGRAVEYTMWDGESYYSGNGPFCTLRCALQFARDSWAAGYRRAALSEDAEHDALHSPRH